MRPVFPRQFAKTRWTSTSRREADRRRYSVRNLARVSFPLSTRHLRVHVAARDHLHPRLFPTSRYHRPSISRSRRAHRLFRVGRSVRERAYDRHSNLPDRAFAEMARRRHDARTLAGHQLDRLSLDGNHSRPFAARRVPNVATRRKLRCLASGPRSFVHSFAT